MRTAKKSAACLIDAADGDIAAGVGINLEMTPQLRARLARPVAALQSPPPRNECALLACRAICAAAESFARGGLEEFLADAQAAHILQDGEDMCFRAGDEEVRGRFAGFGGDGALRIRRSGGVREYFSGEIAHVAGS